MRGSPNKHARIAKSRYGRACYVSSVFFVSAIEVYNVEILFHVESVRSATVINLVTTVIHCKANQRVVVFPVALDEATDHTEGVRVLAKLGESFGAFGAALMHHRIVVSIVDQDQIVLVAQNQLNRAGIDILNATVFKVEIQLTH